MKQNHKAWRAALLVCSLMIMAITMTVTLSSCGDDKDEPKGIVIDYYLDIEEEFLINGSTSHTDRYYSPITRMRDAIRKVYPTPDAKGADELVVEACDHEFLAYREMYSGGTEHFTCLFHLIRAVKQGTKVVQSEMLRTYVYDINTPATDIEQ